MSTVMLWNKHMIKYWIQKSDYSSEEWDNVSKIDILEAFRSFDWAAELDKFDIDDHENNCPCGIGIDINEVLLHICPNDKESVFINYHYVKHGKILGLIPSTKNAIHYVEQIPISMVESLINSHFSGKKEDILSIS